MKCSDYYFSTEYIQDISFVTSNLEHTRTKGAHGKSRRRERPIKSRHALQFASADFFVYKRTDHWGVYSITGKF